MGIFGIGNGYPAAILGQNSKKGQVRRKLTESPQFRKVRRQAKLNSIGMFEFVVVDERIYLGDCSLEGDDYIIVSRYTSIADVVERVLEISDEHNQNVYLKIVGHGFVRPAGTATTLQCGDKGGGFGIQFGKENLRINTLPLFIPSLYREVKRIDLHACGAAYTNVGYRIDGDGKAFCRMFAQMSGVSKLRASDSIQCSDGCSEYGKERIDPWEGTVYTWDQNGVIIDTQDNPEF